MNPTKPGRRRSKRQLRSVRRNPRYDDLLLGLVAQALVTANGEAAPVWELPQAWSCFRPKLMFISEARLPSSLGIAQCWPGCSPFLWPIVQDGIGSMGRTGMLPGSLPTFLPADLRFSARPGNSQECPAVGPLTAMQVPLPSCPQYHLAFISLLRSPLCPRAPCL